MNNATDRKSEFFSEDAGIDLNTADLKAIASRIKDSIDLFAQKTYNDGHRWHLGASKIGDVCRRRLWYGFRWVLKPNHSGRLLRLFQRGHLEENRYIEYLKGIGFKVHSYEFPNKWDWDGQGDPWITVKGKQYRIRGANGHYGGSLDAVLEFPPEWNISVPVLGEFKTNCTGATFTKLYDKGLRLHKPEHYNQTCAYGAAYGFSHVAYFNTNKNDDDMYVEIAKLDFEIARQMELKAEAIIYSQEAPPRYSENANHMECKSMCSYTEICHYNKPPEKNCRSCAQCSPTNNAEFYCSIHAGVIPRDFVPKGCDHWKAITVGSFKSIPIVQEKEKPKSENVGMFEIDNVPMPE